MGIILVLALILLAAIGLFLLSKKARDYDDKVLLRGASYFAVIAFVVTWALSSVFSVEARTIGIVTAFGRPSGDVAGPGLNWSWPWTEVTKFSTSNQTIDFDGTDGNGAPVDFKLAADKDGTGGGEAKVHVNVTWQVQNDDRAKQLWANWKEFDRVKDQLVDKNSRSVVASIMGKYTADEANKGEMLATFAKDIKDQLNVFFADKGISVETTAVMRVDLSPAVQDRINKKYQDQQDIQRAKIQQDRAKVEAETNIIRQQNLTNDVLQLKCLELTNAWNDDNNGQLPAGWNCFGPVGGGLAVK